MTARSPKHREKAPSISTCPCGSGKKSEDCCAHWSATCPPDSAEALMRSRYCAFVRGDANWLNLTWHPQTRPNTLDLQEEPRPQWQGLQVLRHEMTGEDTAVVEFVARYKINGRAQRLHEISRFVRENGYWLYLDGSFPT